MLSMALTRSNKNSWNLAFIMPAFQLNPTILMCTIKEEDWG